MNVLLTNIYPNGSTGGFALKGTIDRIIAVESV